MLKGRNLIDPMDFTVEEIEEILNLAENISKKERILHIFVKVKS